MLLFSLISRDILKFNRGSGYKFLVWLLRGRYWEVWPRLSFGMFEGERIEEESGMRHTNDGHHIHTSVFMRLRWMLLLWIWRGYLSFIHQSWRRERPYGISQQVSKHLEIRRDYWTNNSTWITWYSTWNAGKLWRQTHSKAFVLSQQVLPQRKIQSDRR